jgi:hypothetical protein
LAFSADSSFSLARTAVFLCKINSILFWLWGGEKKLEFLGCDGVRLSVWHLEVLLEFENQNYPQTSPIQIALNVKSQSQTPSSQLKLQLSHNPKHQPIPIIESTKASTKAKR